MKPFYLILVLSFLFSSCEDEKIFFIADHFGDCENQCLLVRENENADWVTIANQIEGFNYEEGYSYKVRLKVEQLDNSITLDKSNFKYTLLEVLSKTKTSNFNSIKIDNHKKWIVSEIQGFENNTNKSPFFSINNGMITGNSGCNTFGGPVKLSAKGSLKVGMLRMTKMYCEEYANLENTFISALSKVTHFKIDGGILNAFDDNNNLLFTASQEEDKLEREWYVSSISGFNKKTGSTPYFSIKDGKINGNNGCNDFSGSIETAQSGVFKPNIEHITKRYCTESAALEKAFLENMKKAAYYKITEGVLFILDQSKYVLMSATTSNPNIDADTAYQPYIIEYNTYSPNYAIKNKVEEIKNTLSYHDLKPTTTKVKKRILTKTDLRFFKEELLKIGVKNLENLKAPSTNYKNNKVAGGSLIVFFEGKSYRVPTFDHGNPPKEIKAIVQKIMQLRSE